MQGVLVTRISEDGKKEIESTNTDGEGQFSFDVPDGPYTTRVEANGSLEMFVACQFSQEAKNISAGCTRQEAINGNLRRSFLSFLTGAG
jgi:hypothetical protein